MPVKRPYEVITFSINHASELDPSVPAASKAQEDEEKATKRKKKCIEKNVNKWARHYAQFPLVLPKSVSPLQRFIPFHAFPSELGHRIENDHRHPPVHILNSAALQTESLLFILNATTRISEYFGVAIFRFPDTMIPSISTLLQVHKSDAPSECDPRSTGDSMSQSAGPARSQAYESQIQKGVSPGLYTLSSKVVDAPVGEWLAKIEVGDVEQMTSEEFWQAYKRKGVKPSTRRRMEVVVYAADLDSSELFPKQHLSPITLLEQPWNVLRHLPTDEWVPGIQTSYSYVGAPYTAFGFHLEDYHAYSGNISLAGAPKVWLIVPASYRYNFELFVQKLLKLTKKQKEDKRQSCEQVLRHAGIIIDEALLPLTAEEQKKHGFRVFKVVQHPGDMIITMPGAYHGGYNLGYNLNQAVNFGTPRWLEAVMDYQSCTCFPDQVPLIIDTAKLKETVKH